MNIFIELPTWLGDTVMATPAIENLVGVYPDSNLTLFGSTVSIQAMENHPSVVKTIVDKSRQKGNRFINLYRYSKELSNFDIAISFRSTLASKFLLTLIKSRRKFQYKKEKKIIRHQVQRYNDLIKKVTNMDVKPQKQKLYFTPFKYDKKTLGINPGATYGSAKRWYPDRFAEVAEKLSSEFDIVIFGGPNEIDIADEIEDILINKEIQATNLAGKTSIKELVEYIGGVDLFITADSGPMHIAAAFDTPTVALFGPTNHIETSPWMNENSHIIRYDMECAPCMKRVCPIKTHECMKKITPDDVIDLYRSLNI